MPEVSCSFPDGVMSVVGQVQTQQLFLCRLRHEFVTMMTAITWNFLRGPPADDDDDRANSWCMVRCTDVDAAGDDGCELLGSGCDIVGSDGETRPAPFSAAIHCSSCLRGPIRNPSSFKSEPSRSRNLSLEVICSSIQQQRET